MNRTAEKVLGIISALLITFGLLIIISLTVFFNMNKENPVFIEAMMTDFENDPSTMIIEPEMLVSFLNLLGGVMWFGVALSVISLILTILGLKYIWKNDNPKRAGILFIITGVLSGIISIPSILLYIAAILALTKKPKMEDDMLYTQVEDNSMRPL